MLGVLYFSHIKATGPNCLYLYFSWPQSVDFELDCWFPVYESSALATVSSPFTLFFNLTSLVSDGNKKRYANIS